MGCITSKGPVNDDGKGGGDTLPPTSYCHHSPPGHGCESKTTPLSSRSSSFSSRSKKGGGETSPSCCSSPEKKEEVDRLSVLDDERLRELQGVVNLRDTFHSFIKHGKMVIDDVHASINQSNLPKTAKAAHALKGACQTIGATQLSRCAELIETEAKAGNLELCKYYAQWLIPCLESIAEEFFRGQYL